jgi:hypothetical protein
VVNANYNAAANLANGNPDLVNREQRHFIQPLELAPPVYINPLLKGATFFSKIEVNIDGQRVGGDNLEDRGYLYQSLNRIFTNDKVRKPKFSEKGHWISTTAERTTEPAVPAVAAVAPAVGPPIVIPVAARDRIPAKIPKGLQRAMEPLVFDAPWPSLDNSMCFGQDGIFPFSTTNCGMCSILGGGMKNAETPYLRPGSSISFVLHKRSPFGICVERANVTDDNYFSNGDCGVAVEVEYTITSITLSYESSVIDSDDQLAALKRHDRQYYVDVPLMRLNICQSGVKHDVQIISLPKNTKLVYICWLYENQFVYNATTHSYLSARFRFPPNMVEASLSMPGKEGLLVSGGIKDLGINTGWNSASLRGYHGRLVREGLYDKDFDSFSPNRRHENLSYDQALVLNLKNYNIEEATQLHVTMKYGDGLSQVRWYMHAFCIVQKLLTCDAKHQWEWKEI